MDITKFGQKITECRKQRAMTQEQLAQELGITAQAVSKWENGLSFPDITLLPQLADVFEVTLDELFDREVCRALPDNEAEAMEQEIVYHELPWDDDRSTLHVVLFAGHRLVGNSLFQRGHREKQQVEFCYEGPALSIQSDFSVTCAPSTSIQGDVRASDSVSCGDVGGSVSAGDGVNCGNVNGNVTAGDGVNCGNVGGNVRAGDSVRCALVYGGARAGDGVFQSGEQ